MAFKKGQGGRPKGSRNKATVALQELAQDFTAEGVAILLSIARNVKQSSVVRVSAVREILDRGHGKPAQALTGADGGAVQVVTRLVVELHQSDGTVKVIG